MVCPVFRVTGRETHVARGKLHLLSTDLSDDSSSHFQDIFAQCLLCGACEDNCSRQLPIREQIVQARSEFSHFYGQHPLQKAFVRKALSSPVLLETLVKAGLSLSRLSFLPAESGLRIKLGFLEKNEKANGDEREQGEVERMRRESGLSYFSGIMSL